MLSVFASIKPHLHLKVKVISIDNLAFKYHYRGTFVALLICSILVTSRQYFGEHIKCIVDRGIPEHVINTFCFFTSTFTVIRHYNETMLQHEALPHPGVGPMTPDDNIKHHAYYQWVPFVLFAQALMFYLPHVLWKKWEGGKIHNLVVGLHMVSISRNYKKNENLKINDNLTVFSRSALDDKISNIKNAFRFIHVNSWWASRMIICEILNLVNICLQIYFTNKFLAGEFYSLGINYVKEDFKGKMDTLDFVFPKMTKCHFYKYGPSGSIQKHDALCVMALNIINEKIYVFLWFWFGFGLILSAMTLLWRPFTMLMHSKSQRFNSFVFSWASPGKINPLDVLVITEKFSFSDWLFLYYIAVNMDPYLFRELLSGLAAELRDTSLAPPMNYDSDCENTSESTSGQYQQKDGYMAIDTVDGIHVKKC